MPKTIELSQALNAKLCHDLAGSIGTVDNCLSLIDNKNQEIGQQAKGLAIEESANLVNRIKFFRIAYGQSEGETKMSLVNLSKLLQDHFLDTKIKFSLNYDPGVLYIDSTIAKTTICLAVIAGDAAIFGGKLSVTVPIKDENPILIKCSGKSVVLKDDCFNALKGVKDTPITVLNCREHYINTLCAHKNYELEVDKSSDSLEFKLNKK